MGPPYPVSASQITGVEGDKDVIVEALESMSFRVAMPRSAVPRRDMFVPAPVYKVDVSPRFGGGVMVNGRRTM